MKTLNEFLAEKLYRTNIRQSQLGDKISSGFRKYAQKFKTLDEKQVTQLFEKFIKSEGKKIILDYVSASSKKAKFGNKDITYIGIKIPYFKESDRWGQEKSETANFDTYGDVVININVADDADSQKLSRVMRGSMVNSMIGRDSIVLMGRPDMKLQNIEVRDVYQFQVDGK